MAQSRAAALVPAPETTRELREALLRLEHDATRPSETPQPGPSVPASSAVQECRSTSLDNVPVAVCRVSTPVPAHPNGATTRWAMTTAWLCLTGSCKRDEAPLVGVRREELPPSEPIALPASQAERDQLLRSAGGQGDEDVVRQLLDLGVRIDPPETRGQDGFKQFRESALGAAVVQGELEVARLLIARGANVNMARPTPLVGEAARRGDLQMLALLLGAGARPDAVGRTGEDTALLLLLRHGASTGKADRLEEGIRRLVSAGADVNYASRGCVTPHAAASTEAVKRLLQELGADPQAAADCTARHRHGEFGSIYGTEAVVRNALAAQAHLHLSNDDHRALERLYARLVQGERTPSGIWKLAVFYAQLQYFWRTSRDDAEYAAMLRRAARWRERYPRSVPAHVFEAYVHWGRAIAYRGSAFYADLPAKDKSEVVAAARKADAALSAVASSKDPEVGHARMALYPYLGIPARQTAEDVHRAAGDAAHYHPTYFEAAFFLRPLWGGSNALLDTMARRAAAATAAKEGFSMYARIYWSLDQQVYRSRLFEETSASWADMKRGFDDITRRYPDAWNLNAYAYFACIAGDLALARSLLRRIGDQLVFAVWGADGASTHDACLRRVHGGRPLPVPLME